MPQKRLPITAEQKAALRAHHRSTHPPLEYRELRAWFEQRYGRSVAASSVSEILSSRYDHLDQSNFQRSAKRQRVEKWPELELALIQWVRRVEDKVILTGDILKQKAEFFFSSIPKYDGAEMPRFSNGWLLGFKTRHSVKQYIHHGEAGSVDQPTVAYEIEQIQQLLSSYDAANIYNCDETGLYWKRIPDRSLATRQLPGQRREKARITAQFCCNATGTDRLPIWYIGRAATPRAFRAAGLNLHSLNWIWRHNGSAWMTGQIFQEWLHWFDRRMSGKKVVLLMDNFSGHELGVELLSAAQGLQNTLVIWLPANSTSVFQPLDQGIIRTWKAYYRKYWLQYLINEIESGRDPIRTMNVLKAVRWGSQAWEMDINPQSIENCFRKSTLLIQLNQLAQPAQLSQPESVLNTIRQQIIQLQRSSYIRHAMDIQTFLNPVEEVVEDTENEIEEQIIAQFEPEIEAESEEEVEELPQVRVSEAIEALSTLRLYEEQSETGTGELISTLNRYERVLQAEKARRQQQQDIRTFFAI